MTHLMARVQFTYVCECEFASDKQLQQLLFELQKVQKLIEFKRLNYDLTMIKIRLNVGNEEF